MSKSRTKEFTAEHRRAVEPYFDEAYYLGANPDVGKAGIDPLVHYISTGWREGRNPSRRFDVGYYLARNTDVAAAGVDPLLHYVWSGRQEGRLARRPLDAHRAQLAAAQDPRRKALEWGGAVRIAEPIATDDLHRRLEETAGRRGLILSISHDDYARNTGGVQNLIGDEQRAFVRAEWSYLHVSPLFPLPMLADVRSEQEFQVGVRLDGTWIGTATVAELANVLARLRGRMAATEAVVHHLMGHAPELALMLIQAAGASRTIVWTHDFFSLCPSFALMRNDVAFCDAPPPISSACGVCCYGTERQGHLDRIRSFFEATRPVVMAPSAPALEFWRRRSTLPHAAAVVQPLARLALAAPTLADAFGREGRPICVAHVGARVFHKGWTVFEDLALRLADDPRYSFVQLGAPHGPSMPGSIRQIPVSVTPEHRGAMIDAIAETGVDVVVSWSLWPETFCYVAHEALAGGAFVVTRRDAGNVWPAIAANAPDRGHVVEDEQALSALFEGEGLCALLSGAPRRRGALILGDGTFDWMRLQPTQHDNARGRVSTRGDEVLIDG